MITALRKPELPARLDDTPLLVECKDWDSLCASVCRLVEENRALRRKLELYRQRYSHLAIKRKLSAGAQEEKA